MQETGFLMTQLIYYHLAGHWHVIDFLIENYPELHFTDLICRTFPDIVGKTLVNFFKEVPTKQQDDFFHVS